MSKANLKTVTFFSRRATYRDPLEERFLPMREPMFFAASLDFVSENGGPLAKEFSERVSKIWPEGKVVVDTRVNMLKPGWYPAIPGWHLDDVPRQNHYGQPDCLTPSYHSQHLAVIVDDDKEFQGLSRTLFLEGNVTLTEIPEGPRKVYGEWNDEIEDQLKKKNSTLRTYAAPDRQLVEFGWGCFHRAQAARKAGWRVFMRASRHTDRKIHNEIRTQVQVYLTNPTAGW